ncbi:MAG: T9SS type A sorting domain-containing protein [Ignavibacteriales bacterium]|nr:T9SS type A sorting domain-containing protein [Ignavibacteriales bacterium]
MNASISIGFYGIYFVDSLYGWTANLGGRPYKTTDGGSNWIQQTDLDIWESRDVFFIDYLNGFLLESNKLYETTDGGITWVQNQNLTGFSIAELSTYEDSTIFIIGYKTYRSLNGGESWDEFTELDGIRITGLNLSNSGSGYSVGELGLMLKYYDSTYVPVELISFRGEAKNNEIILNWQTASEINNQGFEIQKSEVRSKKSDWEKIGFVEGKGTTTEQQFYSFIDKNLTNSRYRYRLKQIDFDGTFEYSDIIEIEIGTPSEFHLLQNYPNPFNPETNIDYRVSEETLVNITLYDITGRKIIELVNEKKQTGYYTLKLKGGALSSGIYFYRLLTSSGYTATKKLTILK